MSVVVAVGGCGQRDPEEVAVLRSAALTTINLPVQGVFWSGSFGEATAACNPANPVETFFGTEGSGVRMSNATIPFGCLCCGCVARVHDYPLGQVLNSNDARLQGFFDADRSNDPFTVASLGVDLIRRDRRTHAIT